ncbi:terminase small subunit [Thalassolituus sp. UBA3500]|uniref:terminase small subunit n=1 Tax=Thalassolituus sp. UBA3500 TaxID=1947664 RepID=UPI000C102656|nr:terminase small subunit [Thalassolituus sp. UBA3500]MBN58740.1 terminase small subunit [Oceanospirillaceae bacterium]|tara:strand:- start:6199 stop:6783 length:585 start_codon:yes stop_codon:yes gene_type:complete
MAANKDSHLLTTQQAEFVRQYLIDMNGTQAAIRAGYSEKTARSQAERLKKIPKIATAIAQAVDERAERIKVDADYVLQRLLEIDQMDVIDILKEDGSFKHISDWPKVWRQYIQGMDLSELWEGRGDEREMVGFLKKIKWPDKVKNLELIGKHVDVQAFKDKVEHEGTIEHQAAKMTEDQIDERIRRLASEAPES